MKAFPAVYLLALVLALGTCRSVSLEEARELELKEAIRRRDSGEVRMDMGMGDMGEMGPGGRMGMGMGMGMGPGRSGVEAATTCDESVLVDDICALEGTSNWHSRDLAYSEGTFSGSITTNLCPISVAGNGMPPRPDCVTQTFPTVTETPAGIPLLGRIGMTFFGENIYSAFEAGFRVDQVCESGWCEGGIDLTLCAKALNATCSGTFLDVGINSEIMGVCGGHADPYHYHEDMVCHYDATDTAAHSSAIGLGLDGRALYGRWEGSGQLPNLDTCNGHWGVVPANATLGIDSAKVYHYHTTTAPPYTFGCFGPVDGLSGCRALYSDSERGCGGTPVQMLLADVFGEDIYNADVDTWCPCYGEDDGLVTATPAAG